jgi:hypothetical protein
MLRIAQPIEQDGDPLQPQHVGAGGEAGQPVELMLNVGAIGMSMVSH